MKAKFLNIGLVMLVLALVLIASGCVAALAPQMSYQGRLTDTSGNPLNGTYRFTFRLYHAATGGTAIYTETKNIAVTNGLFDSVVGPSGVVAGLTPEDLTKPLWIGVMVSDGVAITETLTPRQRLYGSPYAFTMMPGAVISSSMSTTAHGANGLNAILSVVNGYDGDAANPALPALRVVGEGGLQLSGADPVDGSGGKHGGAIYSGPGSQDSDLAFYSNDEIGFYLDADGNSNSSFRVYNGAGALVCSIAESGNLNCTGTKSAVVDTQDGQRKLYAIESAGVWFEDFGSARLTGGAAVVSIDALFAQTVNLSQDYHIFLTPLGDCNGLYVTEKTASSFKVRELNDGSSNVAFDYRIIAKRLGYETVRLEPMSLDQGED